MEINNDINEIVYMKRDIKSHRIYEKHPNLMFGIIILVWGLLLFLIRMESQIVDNPTYIQGEYSK